TSGATTSITDHTTASYSTAEGSTYSKINTTNSLTSDSVNSNQEGFEENGNLNMILIIVGVIVSVLAVCGLIALVVFVVRRNKSNSKNEAEVRDNYVSLQSIKSNVNEDTQYQNISYPY